jgi:hypothetical protein
MSAQSNNTAFMLSDAGVALKQTLLDMVTDSLYITKPGYTPNSDQYPDNIIPFVDKHLEYLRTHPATDPQHYISNLRLMTRVR